MPPSPICTAARKPDGYNKAHLQEFGQVLQAWMISQIPGGAKALDQLVCDGKTPRGSAVETEEGNHRFVAHVTVYARAHGVALVQTTYDTHKSSERAALKELLGKLGLDDALIQADTLNTIRPFFDGAWSRGPMSHAATDLGKMPRRDTFWELRAKESPEHINLHWPGSTWIVEVITDTVTRSRKRSIRWHLFLTSLWTSPDALLQLIRQRWSIENEWHWAHDAQLGEDAHRYASRRGAAGSSAKGS